MESLEKVLALLLDTQLKCTLINPRPYAVGSIKRAYENYPWIGTVLSALGYSTEQLKDLEMSINSVDCEAVVFGTPADLRTRILISKPAVRVRFEGKDSADLAFSQYLDNVFAQIRERFSS